MKSHTFTSVVAMMAALTASPARADDSPYCTKVRARAAADAALLYAPTIQAQGIKFPSQGTVDSGVTTGAGYQFRALATFSPLDIYRGVRVERVGEADCAHHDATLAVQEVAMQGNDIGRLPALKKQLAFFAEHRAEVTRLAKENETRFDAKVSTLSEANDVRVRATEVERAEQQLRGELARLEARGPLPTAGALDAKVATAMARAMAFERESSHLRSLDAWEFRISGGLIPQDIPVDYFAIVQVGFNLGAFSRNANESKYLAAREAELNHARYEASEQARVIRGQAAATLAQSRAEKALLERDLALLDAARTALARSDAPNGPHALALVEIQRFGIHSQLAYIEALSVELASMTNDQEISRGK